MKYFNPGNVYIIIAVLSVISGLLIYITITESPTRVVTEPSVTEPSINLPALNFRLTNPNSLAVLTLDNNGRPVNQYSGTNSQVNIPSNGNFIVIVPDKGGYYYWKYEDLILYDKKSVRLTADANLEIIE